MFFAALTILGAHADCTSGSLGVWPPSSQTLHAGQQIVLEAHGTARAGIADPWMNPLALVNGETQIPLRVVSTLAGSFDQLQLVVEPARPVPPGTWRLEQSGTPLSSWTLTDTPAAGPPVWEGAPQVVGSSREPFGCGPAVEVRVEVPVRDAAWVEVTVWSVDGGERSSARLPHKDGQIRIGHGMCSGAFSLVAGEVYFARLIAVAPDGSRVAADDMPIRFTAP